MIPEVSFFSDFLIQLNCCGIIDLETSERLGMVTELKSSGIQVKYTKEITPKIQDAMKQSTVLGFDIETPICHPTEGRIRLFQVYIPSLDIVAIWDSYDFMGNICNAPGFNLLLQILADENIEKRIHNGNFEYSWIFHEFGVRIKNVLDTLILSQVNKAGLYSLYISKGIKDPNSLRNLSVEFGFELDKKYQNYDFGNILIALPDDVISYGAKDAKATWLLGEKLSYPKQDIDLKVAEVFYQLNCVGFPANLKKCEEIFLEYSNKAQELKTKFQELTGANPASPQQVKKWMKTKWGIVSKSYNRKKKIVEESTNQSAVNQFIASNQNLPDLDILRLMQEFRSVKKFADYPKEYLKNYRDGRVFGNYSTLGFQGEGRTSCKSPNLQNAPKEKPFTKKHSLPMIRGIFQPQDGWNFVDIDAAAAHAQIARDISGDRKLKESNETGVKLHFYTLETMLADMGIKMTPKEIKAAKKDKTHPHNNLINDLYKLSKNVFYSFLNWSGENSLQDTFSKEGVEISIQTCKKYLDATAKTYSDLRSFQRDVVRLVESRCDQYFLPNGESLGFISWLNIPDGSRIYSAKKNATASKLVSGIWLRIEATAMKKSLLRVQTLCDSKWLKQSEIVNFAHDSFVVHCKKQITEEVGETIQSILIEELTKLVPTYQHEFEHLWEGKERGYIVCNQWS